jgi:hypothetical protein
MSITYEKTAFVRLEADGEIVFSDFAGRESEIDVKRTNIIQVLGEMKTLNFIRDMLDRSIRDTLVLANLAPVHRKTPEQKAVILAAAKAREDGTTPRVFVNKADRKMHEKLVRCHSHK